MWGESVWGDTQSVGEPQRLVGRLLGGMVGWWAGGLVVWRVGESMGSWIGWAGALVDWWVGWLVG